VSEKIELQSVRLVRAPENDRPGTKGYIAYAVGPNGREFFTTLSATPTLESDDAAFDQVARAHLRSTYDYLA
jgi:hypothetical protein